jgi:14-3-3 protein epsilon
MEEKIFMVRVAEQAERFEDMYNFLKDVVANKDSDFTTEERNLLSVGFKNLIGSNRTAIRTIGAIEQNPKYQKYSASLLAYRQKIEGELFTQCLSIVNLVKDKCIKLAANSESKAFFLKMAGDYYRYVAESAQGDKLTEVKNGALDYYNQASEIANKDLNACNPIRLGLALNFSVFHYEVMSDHKKACQLGEVALQSALDKIDECDEEMFRDAKSIIELLKENLSLWKEDEAEGGNEIEDL